LAQKTTIDFIEQFKRLRGYELIILTTFTFDPIFFDGALLRTLRRNNSSAKIIVLIDADQYNKSQVNFTTATGIEYVLIPIPESLFHPKIFAFFSSKKNNVFIGSHNLTLPGLTQNLELLYHSNKNKIAIDCLDYFVSLLSKQLNEDNPLLSEISKQLSTNSLGSQKLLLHNLKRPILDQMLEKIKDEKIDEVVIFAPYYSFVSDLLKKIHSIKVKKIKLCIQKGNHNLSLKGLDNFKNLELNEIKAKPPNASRKFHSKFIFLKGKKKTFTLVGSPNFSRPALNSIAEKGNFEAAVLVESNDDFFSAVELIPISKKDITTSARKDFETERKIQANKIIINMAYFDKLNRLNLDISTNYSGKFFLKFFPSNEEKSIEIKKGKNNLVVSDFPIPDYEVSFMENSTSISNRIRICSPKGLRIGLGFDRKNSQSVIDVVKDLKGLDAILVLVSELVTDEEKVGSKSDSDRRNRPSPGLIRSGKSGSSFYDYILDLLKTPHDKKSDIKKESREKSTSSSKKEEVQDIDALILKIIEKFIKFEQKNIPLQPSIKDYVLYFLISLKILKNLNAGYYRGIAAVHTINGFKEMLVYRPINYETEELQQQFSFLNVIVEAANESEKNLEKPYKFDEITILQFTSLMNKFLHSANPLEEIISKLSNVPRYGIRDELDDSRKNIVRTIFKHSLYKIPILQRKIRAEKLLQIITTEKNDPVVLSSFNTLKLFYENDPALIKFVSQRSKDLINSAKYRRFVLGILNEIMNL